MSRPLGPAYVTGRTIAPSRAPARALIRHRPPRAVHLPQLTQARRRCPPRTRHRQDRQRRQLVRHPVRRGRKGQQDVVPRPQLHRGHVRHVQKGQRYVVMLRRGLAPTRWLARERMIGWYHTGPKLRASDQEINDLFKRYISKPVMVIVDVRPDTVGIPTDAYFAVEEIKDVRTPLSLCRCVISQTRVGRHGDTQDISARPLRDRSRRSRRNRRRASPAGH